MNNLVQNLYITYSNQKARDLKASTILNPIDKVITLDSLIVELFESNNFQTIIDNIVASSIVYKIIQEHNIEYFSYLDSDAISLNTIVDFVVKCNRNSIAFNEILKDEKLDAIVQIDKEYQKYKKLNKLVDIADVEQHVLDNWETLFINEYKDVFVDDFCIEDENYIIELDNESMIEDFCGIKFIKSNFQRKILEKFEIRKLSINKSKDFYKAKIIKPLNEVFDNIDEVKTAIRISRKLMEEGADSNDILIVASDIQEYAPLYKLFLDEYEMKGYSSLGTSLSSFFNSNNPQVQIALNSYNSQLQSLKILYKKLGLKFGDDLKEKLKALTTILDDKIGIELTEPNQIVGLSKRYKHIIFIGTDINHFPPKASDNFLYSYEDDLKYFNANNYFISSRTQLKELKRLSDKLYIVTASYSGKRELTPSILIDGEFDDTIDISRIKSVSQMALENQTNIPDNNTSKYYKSITSENFTTFDGNGVDGLKATHLSASQINKYISCPLSYLYSNKIRLQAPGQDEEGFDVMEQGSLMHLCYEHFGYQMHIRSLKGDSFENLDYMNVMYGVSMGAYKEFIKEQDTNENIHHQIFLSTLQAGLKDDRKAGLLAKFVDYYIDKANEFKHFKNTEFEKEFALDNDLKPYKLKDENDKNYFIKGFIDRFDNLDTQINIIDYKSKKMSSLIDKDKMEQIADLKDVQLALYILYASQEYPDKKYHSSLLSFKGDRPHYHFANLANEDDIKNTEFYGDEYDTKLRERIFNTRDSIENGEFSFNNSDEKMCGYCDIKHICHESILKNK